MRCRDCGVNQGSRVIVDGRVMRLCEPCGQDRVADGAKIEGYDEAWEREQDRRADEALDDR
jgi:hypothetical protein